MEWVEYSAVWSLILKLRPIFKAAFNCFFTWVNALQPLNRRGTHVKILQSSRNARKKSKLVAKSSACSPVHVWVVISFVIEFHFSSGDIFTMSPYFLNDGRISARKVQELKSNRVENIAVSNTLSLCILLTRRNKSVCCTESRQRRLPRSERCFSNKFPTH